MRFLKCLLLLAGLIFLVPILPACDSGKISQSEYETKILGKLQEIVPFTIILPEYLPEDIKPEFQTIDGPLAGRLSDHSVLIRIIYVAKSSGDNVIIIEEENATANVGTSNDSSIFLDIKGVKVLEEQSRVKVQSPKSSLLYAWDLNDIQYFVWIFEQNKDECRKVIESMIK